MPQPYHPTTGEQRWIRALLLGLVLFDNPFSAAEIYGSSLAWTLWGVLCDVSFLSLLLLYWLRALDTVGRSPNGERFERSPLWFWAPKIAIVLALWAVSLGLYTTERLERSVDPTYDAVDDMTYYGAIKVASYALQACYLLYAACLVVPVVKAVRGARGMKVAYQWIASRVTYDS